jgi:Sulfotransferase domain
MPALVRVLPPCYRSASPGDDRVTLKIIGAGFGRTGTWSTYTALNQLGFRCYHMAEVLMNPENKAHLDFWRKVANSPPGSPHDWSVVFSKYTATVDNPGCCVWRELMAAYPEAKVVLTLHPRGPEAWYDSTVDTIYFTETMWQFKVLEFFTPFGRKFGDMSRRLIWGRTLKGVMGDKTKAVARYKAYVDEVKASVPADKLLIYSVDEGWEPLCAFLGVPRPAGEFPNLNDRASVKKVIADITRGAYSIVAGLAALLVLLAAALYWWHR